MPTNKTAGAVLESYEKRIESLQERNIDARELKKLEMQDVLYLRALLHPTSRRESLTLTRELIEALCENKVMTARELYEAYGWSDKPVLARLKILTQFALVKREGKKYYIATQRLYELKEKYIERICGL